MTYSGTSTSGLSQTVSGLSPETTYYFCAIATSAEGTSFGAVLTFRTPGAPTATTSAATAVTSGGATLNGAGNPNGNAATAWFRYAPTSPGTCNDTFGTRFPVAGSEVSLGSGTSEVAFSRAISGLLPGTTYFYCAIVRNTYGTRFGEVLSFTTQPTAPSVTTSSASMLTGSTAQLNGSVNPGGAATTAWFRYATSSPGTCNDTFGVRAPLAGGSSIAAGTSVVSFNQPISGLSPNTTYFYCAIASNSVGTSFGSVLSFTTPQAPTVTTTAATLVTNTTAQLNGTVNPNGATTTAYFRFGLTNPGTCNDTFGSRAPTTGGPTYSGTTVQSFAQSIGSLSQGTTYYYCAIATSAEGTSFGAVLSFTTAGPPIVSTLAATPVSSTGATLNGTANPNLNSAFGYFRYGTTNPGTCTEAFGMRAPTMTGSDSTLGGGNVDVTFSRAVTGLLPGTTYFFCAAARNSYGTTFGPVLSFTTPAAPPTVTTNSATALTTTTATLNGSGNPNGDTTTGWFRYSTSSPGTCNDSFGTRAPATGGSSLGSGTSSVSFNQGITGLTPATTYFYCAIVSSSIGMAFGSVVSFTTPNTPTVATLAATPVTSTSATLNASVNPNGFATNGWFRYSTTNPGTCNTTFGSTTPTVSLGSGTLSTSLSQTISALSPATTYFFCAIAQSSIGTSLGEVLSFTTPAAPPTVTTVAASGIGPTTAALNGTANPNGSATTAWFRFATTSPGTCNDTFGTRVPAAGGTAVGMGNAPVAYTETLTGLTLGATYFYCAIASNGVGTSFGPVLSFVTNAAPSVTTVAASSVGSTSATLNGSANPNALSSTGWFRYSTTNPGTCNDTFGTRAPTSGGTALGSGTSAASYSQAITGLTPGATYFYCAIASNASGLGFGAVQSFTTAGAPTVTTELATAVTSSGATLQGTANPNLGATTGWFRYGTVNPGTCNDTFGIRAPSSGGSMLGSGSTPVGYTQGITGLSPGTTYFYCAIASNSVGVRFGTVQSFTTPAGPSVTTSMATGLTATSATLNGAANPNLAAATGYFRYATTSPGTCNDTFGTRAPASGGTALGAGSAAVPFAEGVTGLAPSTTYFYCAIATNGIGTGFGAVMSFTTPAAPTVTTVAATGVSSTGATLGGSANPNRADATGWFRYDTVDPGTCSDTFGTRAPGSGGSPLGAGSSAVSYTQAITGLLPGTTYYYCAVAANTEGTRFGTVLSFTTSAAPTVTTLAATAVSSTGATLQGSANPNRDAATGWFRYAATDPGACNDTFGTRAPASGGASLGAGSSAASYSQPITGLLPGTTYYYCAIASNSVGTRFGTVLTFTTASAPTVTTAAATGITSSSATLTGSANPNLSPATGYFRYSTTNPGTCNDTFGVRTPSSGGTGLGAGSSAVPFSEVVTGLTTGTTYYYCAIASNAAGTAFGAVMSFTTAAAPTVTTDGISALTSTTVTLRGTANPNLSEATGWFRYATTNPGTCNGTFGTRAPLTGGTALGAGASPVGYSEALTGLVPGTTYFYCAIAANATGTGLGTVMSFTTPAAPTVTTDAATAVASTTATLRGTATPNMAEATGWFRYATTDPGTCSDAFGTRAPIAGGTALGAGSSPVAFTQTIGDLSPGTTYYYCAIANNAAGTAFGTVRSFTTASAPTVTTQPATAVSRTGATLNGAASPNGSSSTGWFRYASTSPGTCDDTFGTRAPATGGTALGAGTSSVPYAELLTGLTPGSTYYYCAIASNAAGTRFGEVLSFTTPSAPSAPTVITETSTEIVARGATLNGAATPNLADATGWFRYATTDPGACNDSFGTRAPASGGTALGNGTSPVSFSQAIVDLAPATTYYVCAIASNSVGTRFGEVISFTTAPASPDVTTTAATEVMADSAILNGAALPNGDATSAWFRFDTTDPGECDDTFGTRAPASGAASLGAGTASVAFSELVSGLSAGTVYYFCAIAENAQGRAFGEVLTFMPGVPAPIVTTEAATDVDGTSATLAGTANPNGAAAIGWFRYGTVEPATCDDAFGTRAPASGEIALGAGTAAAPFTQPVTGLAPSTTYYYCAAASNLGGASFGEVRSFTTSAAPPTVRTTEPMIGTVVTLTGAADPRGSATSAWFRYDTSDPGTCNDSFGMRAPSTQAIQLGDGTAEVPFMEPVGLTPGTYYVCAIAENEGGIAFGEVVRFEVPQTSTAGGCGCRVGGSSDGAPVAVLSLLALIGLVVRRRRRA
jgi:MYXO-CTERM domain-containing protein